MPRRGSSAPTFVDGLRRGGAKVRDPAAPLCRGPLKSSQVG